MIYGVVLVLHVAVSLVLIGVILLQGGRGGLSEALGGAAAQSLFGSGAKTVLTRITAMCAGLFVVTCLSLAYLSTVRGRSVIDQVPLMAPETLPATLPPLRPESTDGSATSPGQAMTPETANQAASQPIVPSSPSSP